MKYRCLLLTLVCGCGPILTADSDISGDSGTGNDMTGSTTNEAPTADTSSSTIATSTTDAATSDSSSTTEPDNVFMVPPDGGTTSSECSTFHQDCPRGEKCNAWANDGGNAWNATKCVPLDPDPAEVDEPCSVAGSGVSGLDSCALGSMCWGLDSETEQGYCVPFCTGSESAPLCSDPNRECNITGEGILTLCFLSCDPLEPVPCAQGEACYPVNNRFVCAPDDSADGGGAFEGCEFINACDPGHICVTPELTAMCPPNSGGCCLPVCDTSASDCPAAMVCERFFEPGQIKPGYEDVGVCRDAGPKD